MLFSITAMEIIFHHQLSSKPHVCVHACVRTDVRTHTDAEAHPRPRKSETIGWPPVLHFFFFLTGRGGVGSELFILPVTRFAL